MDCKEPPPPSHSRIALVLQGGGALGAYQAGVFQALHENQLCPDWVVGTSIGAINAALIAGNEPHLRLERLREFWDRISHRDSVDMNKVPDHVRKLNTWLTAVDATMRGVPGFYTPRMMSPFMFGLSVQPEAASFYDTSALTDTLHDLVDFNYLNAQGGMRMTVNALKVTSGELVGFDNTKQTIGPRHIIASGALPPGFPGVRVDGELYWDGGLYSNTPLETVLEDEPRKNTLCFMVDLWSPDGEEPTNLDEVQTRQKDVTYASRSKRHIEAYQQLHNMRRCMYALQKSLPPEMRDSAEIKLMAAHGCNTTMHIVHLPYSGRDWNMASKDINFSKGSINWRWELGYHDACRAIKQAGWLNKVEQHTGVIVHELPRETGELEI
ncbi:MAG: patatin-like phospholipase family protein [Proteobacteria bacterium]|nr:patatin-like phospholipase family protein [Pseudomonadota bacterium]